jgi:hypothetical protein
VKTLLLSAGAAAVLAAAGLAHGLRTDRWGASQEVTAAAERLESVPARVGEWESQPVEVDQRQREQAQVVGQLARSYVHKPTGQAVLVMVVSGRPGAIGAHSPDTCFQGAGFRMIGEPELRVVEAAGRANEFRHVVASKEGPNPEHLSLWWGWSVDGDRWEAPKDARLRFFRSPQLYKIYFIRALGEPKAGEDAPTVALMQELLPQLRETLTR